MKTGITRISDRAEGFGNMRHESELKFHDERSSKYQFAWTIVHVLLHIWVTKNVT